MKITDPEYDEDDPNFIIACKIDGVSVFYGGPKVFGYELPGSLEPIEIVAAVGGAVIDKAREGYYRDSDMNGVLSGILARPVYHGKLYRRNV